MSCCDLTRITEHQVCGIHDDVSKWEYFSRYWPFVRGIHWSPVDSPSKGQWFQSDAMILIVNSATLKRHEILREDVLSDIEKGPRRNRALSNLYYFAINVNGEWNRYDFDLLRIFQPSMFRKIDNDISVTASHTPNRKICPTVKCWAVSVRLILISHSFFEFYPS